jgi:hypothetical protein
MSNLIPKTTFSDGDIITPEILNQAFISPVFDGQSQYLGHREGLLDTELSDEPGNVKDKLNGVVGNFTPSVHSGLTIAYTSGNIQDVTDTLRSIPAGLIVCPDNATSYVYIDDTYTVKVSDLPPVFRSLIARVTTVSGSVTSLEDMRVKGGIPEVRPVASSIRSFGGRGDQGDYVAIQGDILDQGEYYFSSFTVAAGISISIDKLAKIYVSGDVNIDGTVNVTPAVAGGGSKAWFIGNGIIGGGEAGTGFGAGGGEFPADPYNYNLSPVGSAGAAGYYAAHINSFTPWTEYRLGGDGGGCFWLEAAGDITITGSINADGDDGSDYKLIYHQSLFHVIIGGSGGGSGGLVLLRSLSSININPGAVISAGAGDGGDGMYNSSINELWAEQGSGGGGGRIVLAAPTINTTGASLNVNAGTMGVQVDNSYDDASYRGVFAAGGVGGSFGGLGGHQVSYADGEPGVVSYNFFVPAA